MCCCYTISYFLLSNVKFRDSLILWADTPVYHTIVMDTQKRKPSKDTTILRESIIETCLFLYDIGYFLGTWGNAAVSVEEGLLVTPSRIPYSQMTPDDFVVVSRDGEKIKGRNAPTSEMHMHRLILNNRPEFGVSLHIHSPAATALSCTHRPLPVCTEEMAQVIGGEAACTHYIPAGRHLDFACEVSEKMGLVSAAVMVANHGAVVCGYEPDDTVLACRVLEKTADIYIKTLPSGQCIPIPQTMVEEEHYRYRYKYGKEGTE